jgi:hypothetical protein
MIGSLDCMHWPWKNCPTALQGTFGRGDHHGQPTIVLEAVASRDLWIWHAYFGAAGSSNDINVLNDGHLFNDVISGRDYAVDYEINGNRYERPYYLVDSIYPNWSRFVKTVRHPVQLKHKLFAKVQEGARKDVERAFGVLQARWHIISRPARVWDRYTISDIMHTCIILHNMIVEEERDKYERGAEEWYNEPPPDIPDWTPPELWFHGGPLPYQMYVAVRGQLKNDTLCRRLQEDLIEHIWDRFGADYNPDSD